MKLKNIRISILTIVAIMSAATVALAADDAAMYLIMNDIPPYVRLTQSFDAYTHNLKTIPGYNIYNNAGILAGADHFLLDHVDMTYKTEYQSDELDMGVVVQVTQHAGSDSDKWLLHEVDSGFRDKYGIPAVSYYPWQIDSQTVFINAVGGREYRWISGYKVVDIQYHGSLTQRPEPLEVVKLYLAKHPSTLPAMTLSQLRSSDNKTQWIKDEMDRRLWLSDKWFGQLSAGKTDQKTALAAAVKSMNVFLDYREKYYGIKATDDKNLLASYLNANDITNIQAKLQTYKTWWTANKSGSITLP